MNFLEVEFNQSISVQLPIIVKSITLIILWETTDRIAKLEITVKKLDLFLIQNPCLRNPEKPVCAN